jgi:hypothetical protein
MSRFFVPYTGEAPTAIEIKGHRLLIVASSANDLDHTDALLGSDKIRELYLFENEEAEVLARLAKEVRGGIVLTPPGVPLHSMLSSLEQELPWLH